MSFREDLQAHIENARRSPAYGHYLAAREEVLALLDAPASASVRPSEYWELELSGFEYLLDASPLVVERLREHCHHLTGLRAYDYRPHHEHKAGPFLEKLESLRAVDRWNVFVPEPSLLGGFGFHTPHGRANLDTLKFFEALIALGKASLLEPLLESRGEKKTVLEIGSGWGGFAYQLKSICPKITYILVDLPQTLLLAATYLRTAFPDAPVAFWRGDAPPAGSPPSQGFLLVPHHAFGRIRPGGIDLAVNLCSFQEMTTGQVGEYAAGLRALGVPALYSLNRDRSSHNQELSAVSEILSGVYRVEQVHVLRAAYTALGKVLPADTSSLEPGSPREYRHLVARV